MQCLPVCIFYTTVSTISTLILIQIMKSHEENNVVLPMRAQQAVQHIQLPSVSGTSNMAIGSASPSK